MIRLAAVGDLHFGPDLAGTLRSAFEDLSDRADVLLLAGDLTRVGDPAEAGALADELRDLPIPTVAVLGNHDYHSDRSDQVQKLIQEAGIRVLEGESAVLDVGDARVGVAGVKGFGGGFAGACGSDFGEPEMKSFVRHTKDVAVSLEAALESLDTDVRVALMHYAPTEQTLQGERLEIYPFLGSYLLGEAVDRAGASLIIHGHAHRGSEKGVTPGGTPVRNVALQVIHRPYNVYRLEDGRALP
jgi:Icc-related predicted phosphoesterase